MCQDLFGFGFVGDAKGFVIDTFVADLSSRAAKAGGSFPSRLAMIDQYSSGTKAWISRSRSVMTRTATDCTRPADKPRRTFFHKSGLIW